MERKGIKGIKGIKGRKRAVGRIPERGDALARISEIYLFFIFVIFPLYYYDRYLGMAFYKWSLFMAGTFLLAVLLGVGWLIRKVLALAGARRSGGAAGPSGPPRSGRRFGGFPADLFVRGYFLSALVTYFLCQDRRAAWIGVDGWYMGFVTQAALVFVYLVFSGIRVRKRGVYLLACAGCAATAAVAVLQRSGVDFLHLYYGMTDEVVRDYLSTIGNRTWFSGYYCSVFPIAIPVFLRSGHKWARVASGAFLALSAACLLMSYSDSAIAVFGVLLVVVGADSLRGAGEIRRYLEMLAVMTGAWCAIALVYRLCSERMRVTRGLSALFLDIRVASLMLLLVLALYISVVFRMRRGRFLPSPDRLRKWRRGLWAAVLSGAVFLVLFILCNTAGLTEKFFGSALHSGYLFFDDGWGDYRGFAWKLTLRMYRELPFRQKLFGVGQDCFAWYAYGREPYVSELRYMWGGIVLANSHNEWLNSLFCGGILGAVSYFGIFACVAVRGLRGSGEDNLTWGVGLCAIAYIVHNFFCYQQVSAAVPIFILMGIASRRTRDGSAPPAESGK